MLLIQREEILAMWLTQAHRILAGFNLQMEHGQGKVPHGALHLSQEFDMVLVRREV